MSALSQIIERLESPVSPEEAADYWTTESKAGIAAYFRRLQQGSSTANVGLIRGLDAWGVRSGSLWKEALDVNRKLLSEKIAIGRGENSN